VFLFLVAVVDGQSRLMAETPIEISEKIRTAYAVFNSSSIESEFKAEGRWWGSDLREKEEEGENRLIFRSRLFFDDGRYDVSTVSTAPTDKGETPRLQGRRMWDGKTYLARDQMMWTSLPEELKTRISAAISIKSQKEYFYSDWTKGNFLLGYIRGDSFADMIKNANTARIRDAAAMLGDHTCVVIEGNSSIGEFTFWMDRQSWLVRKAVISQKQGDGFHTDNKLPLQIFPTSGEDFIEKREIVMDDVKIEQVGGKWVKTSGRQTETSQFRSGGGHRAVATVQFRVDLNPDFAALGAFVMDGIPEGTQVVSLDFAPHIRYIWSNGKPIIDHTEDVIRAIDDAIAEAKLRSAKATTSSNSNEPAPSGTTGQPKSVAVQRGSLFWKWGVGLVAIIAAVVIVLVWHSWRRVRA